VRARRATADAGVQRALLAPPLDFRLERGLEVGVAESELQEPARAIHQNAERTTVMPPKKTPRPAADE